VGWHNCYITLHGEGGVEKNGIFLLYNMWTVNVMTLDVCMLIDVVSAHLRVVLEKGP